MNGAARKLIALFVGVSGLAGILLVASLIGEAVFPSGGVPALHALNLLSSALASVILWIGMFVAWYLLDRLTERHFDLDAALDEIRKLTSVIDTSYDGIVLTDMHGIIRHVNPKWVSITGWTAEEVEGKMSPAILKSGYQDSAFYSHFWLTIQNGKTFRGELINKRKDGKYYHVDEMVLPIKGRDGHVTGYAAFHHVLDPDYTPPSPPPYVRIDVERS